MKILKSIGREFTKEEIRTASKVLVAMQPAIDEMKRLIDSREFETPEIFGNLMGSIMLFILSEIDKEYASGENIVTLSAFMQFFQFAKKNGLAMIAEMQKEENKEDKLYEHLLKNCIKE